MEGGGGGSFIVSYEQCDYTQPWVLHLQKKKKKKREEDREPVARGKYRVIFSW